MEETSLIGLGEAGRIFIGSPAWRGSVRAYDIKQHHAGSASEMYEVAAALCVRLAADLADVCDGADVVISLVTASQALTVAEQAARTLAPGCLFLDCNSVAPNTKRAAASTVEAAGGRYVDVAVMAPVLPARLTVPLLVAGAHAGDAVAALRRLGFSSTHVVSDAVGAASAIKMMRSIMVKGLEALTAECFLAAEAAGVRVAVAASLDASWPGVDWSVRADYNLDRMLVHGERRADEMAEVVATIEALGLDASMSRQTASRHRVLGRLGAGSFEGLAAKLTLLLQAVAESEPARRNAA